MKRKKGRSVQCEATCHDLHPVCYGRYVEVDIVKEKGEKAVLRFRSEGCACSCHKEAENPAVSTTATTHNDGYDTAAYREWSTS